MPLKNILSKDVLGNPGPDLWLSTISHVSHRRGSSSFGKRSEHHIVLYNSIKKSEMKAGLLLWRLDMDPKQEISPRAHLCNAEKITNHSEAMRTKVWKAAMTLITMVWLICAVTQTLFTTGAKVPIQVVSGLVLLIPFTYFLSLSTSSPTTPTCLFSEFTSCSQHLTLSLVNVPFFFLAIGSGVNVRSNLLSENDSSSTPWTCEPGLPQHGGLVTNIRMGRGQAQPVKCSLRETGGGLYS